ncbi:MAG: ATP-binding protein [Gammaproteobacteria bacterium]|nr:ATP-binding protein [Gammaproteobacteria bacterium]
MDSREDRLVQRLFYLAGVLLLALVGLNSWLGWQDSQVSYRLQKAIEFQRQITSLYTSILDGESGMVGYVLTGNEDYLHRYELARRQYQGVILLLQQHSHSHHPDVSLLNVLEVQIKAAFVEMDEVLDSVKRGSRALSIERIQTQFIHTMLMEIRRGLGELEWEEDVFVHQEQQQINRYHFWRFVLVVVEVFLILMMGWLILHSLQVRRRALRDQHELQSQLLQAKKLESVGQLTAGIAHDFNNILAGINGFSQLAQRKYGKLDPSGELSDYLREVIEGGRRAQTLVRQLLAYSRNRGGNLQTVVLQNVLEAVAGLLRASIPSSIVLRWQPDGLPLRVKIDVVQFQQALVNVVINSRDAIGQMSGEIKLSLELSTFSQQRCSSCSAELSGEYVCVHVADTGRGMEPEVAQRVFEPFFTTKISTEGSGMGLAVVHGILHGANGHVVLRSTPGMGTTVTLLLPQATD